MIKKIKIPNFLISLLIFSIILNILRVILFNTSSFIYIIWNIFLAIIPFIISSLIGLYINKNNFFNPIFIFGFFVWLIFLPNAPYVVTDFIHLGEIRTVPLMYDIILLFVSATVSLMFGIISLKQVEDVFNIKFSVKISKILIITLIFFTSFGIYLGRTLRFNSWDFFINHNPLLRNIFEIFTKPDNHLNAYFYTVIFFFLIYTFYTSFKNINK